MRAPGRRARTPTHLAIAAIAAVVIAASIAPNPDGRCGPARARVRRRNRGSGEPRQPARHRSYPRHPPIRGGSATGGRGEDVDAARPRPRAVGIDARVDDVCAASRLRSAACSTSRPQQPTPPTTRRPPRRTQTACPSSAARTAGLGADDVRRGAAARARRGRGARGVVQAPRGRGARVRGRVRVSGCLTRPCGGRSTARRPPRVRARRAGRTRRGAGAGISPPRRTSRGGTRRVHRRVRRASRRGALRGSRFSPRQGCVVVPLPQARGDAAGRAERMRRRRRRREALAAQPAALHDLTPRDAARLLVHLRREHGDSPISSTSSPRRTSRRSSRRRRTATTRPPRGRPAPGRDASRRWPPRAVRCEPSPPHLARRGEGGYRQE